MKLALVLLFLAFLVWFFVFRNKEEVEEAMREEDRAAEAPYKLEPPTEAQKLEAFELKNGDLDAPDDLAKRAMELETERAASQKQ